MFLLYKFFFLFNFISCTPYATNWSFYNSHRKYKKIIEINTVTMEKRFYFIPNKTSSNNNNYY